MYAPQCTGKAHTTVLQNLTVRRKDSYKAPGQNAFTACLILASTASLGPKADSERLLKKAQGCKGRTS